MTHLASAVGDSTDILAVANQPVLWACAIGVFAVILVQSVVYMAAAMRAVEAADMTRAELNQAFRSGGVAAIGPSLAVVVVAVALLAVFGTPAVLVRIGLIGSAAYETAAAGISANTVAAFLGAFFSLGVAEWPKSTTHVITFVTSAAVMGVLVLIGKRLKLQWLAEWAFGIAIVAGLVAAYIAFPTP